MGVLYGTFMWKQFRSQKVEAKNTDTILDECLDLKYFLRNKRFWITVLVAAYHVLYDYPMFFTMKQFVQFHGAKDSEGTQFVRYFVLELSILGFLSSVIPGMFLKFSNKKTMKTINLWMILLTFLIGFTTWYPIDYRFQYVSVTLIIVRRTIAWCMISSSYWIVFPVNEKIGNSKGLGCIYSIGGTLGVVCNTFTINALIRNPVNFFWFNVGATFVGIFIYLIDFFSTICLLDDQCRSIEFQKEIYFDEKIAMAEVTADDFEIV